MTNAKKTIFDILESIAGAVAANALPPAIGKVASAAIELGFEELDKATDGLNSPAKRAEAEAKANAEFFEKVVVDLSHPRHSEVRDNITKPAAIRSRPRFSLGPKSNANLTGVHPDLVKTVSLAIQYSEQDFTVFEGLRTLERQRTLLKIGASEILDSYHLRQRDGFGHAVDLVPWIRGKAVWDWEGCFKIACAMDRAAAELGTDRFIVWGAVWDYPLSLYGSNSGQDVVGIKAAVEDYKERHAGKDFIDGPHFQFAR